jgi:hypothetical protein
MSEMASASLELQSPRSSYVDHAAGSRISPRADNTSSTLSAMEYARWPAHCSSCPSAQVWEVTQQVISHYILIARGVVDFISELLKSQGPSCQLRVFEPDGSNLLQGTMVYTHPKVLHVQEPFQSIRPRKANKMVRKDGKQAQET